MIVVNDLAGNFGDAASLGPLYRHIEGRELSGFLDQMRTYVRGVNSGAIIPGSTVNPHWVVVLAGNEGIGNAQLEQLNQFATTTGWGSIIGLDVPLAGPSVQNSWPGGVRVTPDELGPGQLRERCEQIAQSETDQHPDFAICMPDGQRYATVATKDGVRFVIGMGPDNTPYPIRLGGDTNSALVTGATGKGKSVAINTMVGGLCTNYDPSQVAIMALDFKHGVGASDYVQGPGDPTFFPHVKMAATDANNDPEYGVVTLDFLLAESARRATAMKRAGVSNMEELRQRDPDAKWPHVVLIIDEFQILIGDPKVGPAAIERLITIGQQGRQVGISLVLATQTLEGIANMWTKMGALMKNVGIRVALGGGMLDQGKEAPKSLQRGNALVSTDGGVTNVGVTVPSALSEVMRRTKALVHRELPGHRQPHIFDGKDVPDLEMAEDFQRLRSLPPQSPTGRRRPTRVILAQEYSVSGGSASFDLQPNQPGGNLTVLTDRRRDAHRVLSTASRSIAAQTPPGTDEFVYVCLDPQSVDDVERMAEELMDAEHRVQIVTNAHDAATLLTETSKGLTSRDASTRQHIFVYGADLESHVMSQKADRTTPSGIEALGQLIKDGSERGVHIFSTWNSAKGVKTSMGGITADATRIGVVVSSANNQEMATLQSAIPTTGALKDPTREGRLKLYNARDPRGRGLRQVIPYAAPNEYETEDAGSDDVEGFW